MTLDQLNKSDGGGHVQSLMAQCPHLSTMSIDQVQRLVQQKQSQVDVASKRNSDDGDGDDNATTTSCPYGFDLSTMTDDDLMNQCPYMKDLSKCQANQREFECGTCKQFIVQCVTLLPCNHSFCSTCYDDMKRKQAVTDEVVEEVCKICKQHVEKKVNDQFKQFIVDSYVQTLYPTPVMQFQFALQQSVVSRSLHYGKKALEMFQRGPQSTVVDGDNDGDDKAVQMNDELLGVIYGKLADWSQMCRLFDDAKQYYEQSVKHFRTDADSLHSSMYISMIKLSDLVQYGMNRPEEAEPLLREAIELSIKHGCVIEAVNARVKLSDALLKQNQTAEAMNQLKESEKTIADYIAHQHTSNDPSTIEIHKATQIQTWIQRKLDQYSE